MTVFYATPYIVGGQLIHGGEEEVHYDPMPEGLVRVWEIEPYTPGDTRPWTREGDIWSMPDEPDSREVTWTELLDEFGPVTDDEADAAIGTSALADREHAAYLALLYGTV